LIAKPKMTEKYLKKPPFRFLHDIVCEVVRTTEFAKGLYNESESDAANLSDKQAKVDFLNKSISCVAFALAEKIDVSANKIVAGLEADKTNLWLQKLHQAATTCVGAKSDEAVQRVMSGESIAAPKKEKKKKDDDAPPPPPPEGGDDAGAAAAGEEEAKKQADKERREARKRKEEEKKKKAEEEANAAAAQEAEAAAAAEAEAAAAAEADRQKKEADKQRREDRKRQQQAEEEEARRQQAEADQQQNAYSAQPPPMEPQAAPEDHLEQQAPMPSPPGSAGMDGGRPPNHDQGGMPEDASQQQGMVANRGTLERPRTAGRRPPKVASKVTTANDTPAAAPVVVMTDGGKEDDDEDMFEAPAGGPGGPALKVGAGEQHGKLVQDLLAQQKKEEEKERLRKEEEQTREEVEVDGGNKGIKMGKLKKKKASGSTPGGEIDISKLGDMIQQLCQAANPLGKSIDLVHQDIANMGKELDKWKQQYHEASEQYNKELHMTDDLLQPLYQKVAELDDKIAEQVVKIRNSRSRIAENDRTMSSLLEAVVAAK